MGRWRPSKHNNFNKTITRPWLLELLVRRNCRQMRDPYIQVAMLLGVRLALHNQQGRVLQDFMSLRNPVCNLLLSSYTLRRPICGGMRYGKWCAGPTCAIAQKYKENASAGNQIRNNITRVTNVCKNERIRIVRTLESQYIYISFNNW